MFVAVLVAGVFTKDVNALSSTQQVITVIGTGGYKATVSLYEKNSNGLWDKKISVNGFVGKNGITNDKREGDGKTPTGLYTIWTGFGINSNPGTKINYRKITKNDYWVDDPNSKYYNQWVDITKVKKDWKSAERLSSQKVAYKYGVVVNYNTDSIIKGKGSAIFLHNSTNGYTAGCVSIPESALVNIMKQIKPNAKILIAKDKREIPESNKYKKILTNDIYKYDAGSDKYLTYINGNGYSQYSYLNSSGKYAFTPSSWMSKAGLNVTMPMSENGYKMYITNPYIKMLDEANVVLEKAKQGILSSTQIRNEINNIDNIAKISEVENIEKADRDIQEIK